MAGNTDSAHLDRRDFLRAAGAAAVAASALGALPSSTPDASAQVLPDGAPKATRRNYRRRGRDCYRYRVSAAKMARKRNSPMVVPENNGEEAEFSDRRWSFSKALPHDTLGHVQPSAYSVLLAAVETGDPVTFEAIPIAGPTQLKNPQAGLAFDLQGPDSFGVSIRPAPRVDGPEHSAEMAELYWMALARDVPFATWEADPTIAAACDDLSRFSDYRAPHVGGRVVPGTLFRGNTTGDVTGPFVSQFLLRDVPVGSLTISPRQVTALPGTDYLTAWDDWLAVQNGAARTSEPLDPTPRYIRSLRDLCRYVHVDQLYQAYVNACLILLDLQAPIDPGLPPANSRNQYGFVEFGPPHVLSLVAEVATRALKAVWAQKWFVHRRMRPEEFGGRVHNHLTGRFQYGINGELLASDVLPRIYDTYGSFLLPMAFPEGCPAHPAYASGHATVAGACVTVLKAFFDEGWVLPDPVDASPDGLSLVPWTGAPLTVGGELDKVAANIATGRNAAGVHWRTDFVEGVLLGERVAIGILEEQKGCYNQDFTWTLTRFDGSVIQI
jgi:hypothetical protein